MSRMNIHLQQVGHRKMIDLLFFTLCVLVAGCSLTPSEYLAKDPARPTRALVDNVPFFAQDELQCGPASLAMALNWSGIAVTPPELSPEVYTPALEGSLQNSLIGSTRGHGRVPYPVSDVTTLMAEISAGHPVIVLVNLGFSWYPRWHYAVVIGYDLNEEVMILHSGLTARETISFWTFNNIWKRSDYWGLLILPPDRLPKVALESKWLSAVAGLETAEQWQAASIGYVTAIKRWDKNVIAWMGLGNSNYNLGNLDASAEAFFQATRLQPENGIAYNNLADVLAKQGKLDKAFTFAQRAVELGGPLRDTFRQTLAEIRTLQLEKTK